MNCKQDSDITLLYLNPVGNNDDDQTFADMAAKYKDPRSKVLIASFRASDAPAAMTNLEYRIYESRVVAPIVQSARYCAMRGIDSLVIGCFYDPALLDAREVSGATTVVGPCQASLHVAAQLANRFSVLIGHQKWEFQMRRNLRDYGFAENLASFRAINLGVDEFHRHPQETRERLRAAALKAVLEDRAEAIILGCTMEIGFFEDLQVYLTNATGAMVPVIDPSIAALKVAERAATMGRFGWRTSRVGSMASPPEAELLASGAIEQDFEFGNVIEVCP